MGHRHHPRHHRLLLRLALPTVLVMGLGASACSKDDAAPLPTVGATTPPLAKEDYVLRANRVCAASDKEITNLTNSNGPVNNNSGQQSTDALKALVGKITPIAQNAVDQLKSLTPPPEDAALTGRGIALMQAKITEIQSTPAGTLDPIGQPDQELYDYGLSNCFTKPGG